MRLFKAIDGFLWTAVGGVGMSLVVFALLLLLPFYMAMKCFKMNRWFLEMWKEYGEISKERDRKKMRIEAERKYGE